MTRNRSSKIGQDPVQGIDSQMVNNSFHALKHSSGHGLKETAVQKALFFVCTLTESCPPLKRRGGICPEELMSRKRQGALRGSSQELLHGTELYP